MVTSVIGYDREVDCKSKVWITHFQGYWFWWVESKDQDPR